MAKRTGAYGHLRGGTGNLGLRMLTGSPGKQILHAAHTKEELYRLIKDQTEAGNYLTVGAANRDDQVGWFDFRTRMDVGKHEYSVLAVRKYRLVRRTLGLAKTMVVKLRDPHNWGEKTVKVSGN